MLSNTEIKYSTLNFCQLPPKCVSIGIGFVQRTPLWLCFLGIPWGHLVYPYHVAKQCCATMQTRARISNQLSVVIPQFYTTITSYPPSHVSHTLLFGFDPEVDPIPIWNYVPGSYVSNSEYPSYS